MVATAKVTVRIVDFKLPKMQAGKKYKVRLFFLGQAITSAIPVSTTKLINVNKSVALPISRLPDASRKIILRISADGSPNEFSFESINNVQNKQGLQATACKPAPPTFPDPDPRPVVRYEVK